MTQNICHLQTLWPVTRSVCLVLLSGVSCAPAVRQLIYTGSLWCSWVLLRGCLRALTPLAKRSQMAKPSGILGNLPLLVGGTVSHVARGTCPEGKKDGVVCYSHIMGISRAGNLARVLLQTLCLSTVQMFGGIYHVPGTF